MSQRPHPHASFLSAFTCIPHTAVHQDDGVVSRTTAGRWSRSLVVIGTLKRVSLTSISGFRNHLYFYGMGWLAPCPTPNLEGQGFLSGYPSLSHNIPLFERRRIPAFCRCRSAAVQLHYRGYDEDMRQPTWWQSLWHGGHFPAFTKYTWWPQCTPPGPLTTLQPHGNL